MLYPFDKKNEVLRFNEQWSFMINVLLLYFKITLVCVNVCFNKGLNFQRATFITSYPFARLLRKPRIGSYKPNLERCGWKKWGHGRLEFFVENRRSRCLEKMLAGHETTVQQTSKGRKSSKCIRSSSQQQLRDSAITTVYT